ENFKTYFWNEQGYLNDVIIPGQKVDASIRPNQIYVLSLPFSLLDKKSELKVLETVEKHLFTEYGLRSLAPQHPDFRPLYQGSPWDRDTAYHQGTVWPFLIGDYWIAFLKLHKNSQEARQKVLAHFKTLKHHFYQEAAIGGISEIFDGENPGPGKGTVHQAWSVSVLIKLFMDYKLFELPKPELV
ncbi:MAG: amylo-alpha-1,6-glucosidase, partial [Bacteroidota bacterium]